MLSRWLCLHCGQTHCGGVAPTHADIHVQVRIVANVTIRLQCTFYLQTHPAHVIAIHTTNLKVWCHECNQEVFPRANIPGWQWAERLLSDNNVERIMSMGTNASRVLLQ